MVFKRSSSLRKSNEPGFKESRAQWRFSYLGDLELLASRDAILLKEPAPNQEHPNWWERKFCAPDQLTNEANSAPTTIRTETLVQNEEGPQNKKEQLRIK